MVVSVVVSPAEAVAPSTVVGASVVASPGLLEGVPPAFVLVSGGRVDRTGPETTRLEMFDSSETEHGSLSKDTSLVPTSLANSIRP